MMINVHVLEQRRFWIIELKNLGCFRSGLYFVDTTQVICMLFGVQI